MKGKIFNIQRFSTHDGPGIRTVVFLCGCPLRCFWCQNPESQSVHPVLMQKEENCRGCGKCVAQCARKAITVVNGRAVIDRDKCMACGACAKVCSTESLILSGYEADVDEIMVTVLKDRQYYMESGGGLTLSGGEATAQPEFALALLTAAKEKHLHTAIETCGFVSEETLARFLPVTDLFLYDIKAVDSEKHRRGTGRDNALILKNAAHIAAEGKKIKIRMPLIPGFNDSREDVLALKNYVNQIPGLDSSHIELLKYNNLGEVKYKRMGKNDVPSYQPQSDEYFSELCALLK